MGKRANRKMEGEKMGSVTQLRSVTGRRRAGPAAGRALGVGLTLLLSLPAVMWVLLHAPGTSVSPVSASATLDGGHAVSLAVVPAAAAPVAPAGSVDALVATPDLMAQPAAGSEAPSMTVAFDLAPASAVALATPAAPASAVALVAIDRTSPTQAVFSFYQVVVQHRFDLAAQLWTPRMRAMYPPSVFIFDRFDRTRQITVRRATLLSLNEPAGRATVAVDLAEVSSFPAFNRTWSGTWQLVRTPSGWLLDQPNFGAG